MIFSETELSALYNKAREAYAECIQREGNAYLKDESPIPIEQIELTNSSVKIVFFEHNVERDNIEVTISLWDKSSIMGEYVYIVDNMGNALDKLVFYRR